MSLSPRGAGEPLQHSFFQPQAPVDNNLRLKALSALQRSQVDQTGRDKVSLSMNSHNAVSAGLTGEEFNFRSKDDDVKNQAMSRVSLNRRLVISKIITSQKELTV